MSPSEVAIHVILLCSAFTILFYTNQYVHCPTCSPLSLGECSLLGVCSLLAWYFCVTKTLVPDGVQGLLNIYTYLSFTTLPLNIF